MLISLALLQPVNIKNPEKWQKLLKLLNKFFISSEQHDEFQRNAQEKCDL